MIDDEVDAVAGGAPPGAGGAPVEAERLARLDSCAVSDALDALGLRGVVAGLQPLSRPARVLAGPVVTVRVVPRRDAAPGPHLGTRAVMAAAPGDVIVVDNRGRLEVSAWGGLLSLAATQRGVAGVIVDGACRDVDDALDLGLPLFARAPVPTTARGRIVEEACNEPVTVGGVTVCPGDLVIADGSGVVFVPRERAAEVVLLAERISAREEEMARWCREGRSIVDVMHDSRFDLAREEGDADG